MRVLAKPRTNSRFDRFGQFSIGVHSASAHHDVQACLPPSHRLGQVNFQTAEDDAGRSSRALGRVNFGDPGRGLDCRLLFLAMHAYFTRGGDAIP